MTKRKHFKRAQEHLESDDNSRLIYAALELRFCIEEIVYSKLQTYAKRLPNELKKKWQPPQALKALLDIEPDADRSFFLRIAREIEPGVPGDDWQSLGQHHSVSLKWLRKNYNKLGSYLHATMPFVPPKYPYQVGLERRRKSLESIFEELKPAVASSIDASLAMVVTFECGACGSPIPCNEDGLEKSGKAVCLDPDCGVEHEATRDESGEWVIRIPSVSARCHLCDCEFWVRQYLLRIGHRIVCPNCEARFVLQWSFHLLSEGSSAESAEEAPKEHKE